MLPFVFFWLVKRKEREEIKTNFMNWGCELGMRILLPITNIFSSLVVHYLFGSYPNHLYFFFTLMLLSSIGQWLALNEETPLWEIQILFKTHPLKTSQKNLSSLFWSFEIPSLSLMSDTKTGKSLFTRIIFLEEMFGRELSRTMERLSFQWHENRCGKQI